MKRTWQIQDANSRLSEVIDEAIERGPQILTRRDEEIAVVLSYAEYLRLTKKAIPLSEFLRESPLGEIELERDRGAVRPEPRL